MTGREVSVDYGIKILPRSRFARQIAIRTSQRASASSDDTCPAVLELKPQPVEKKHRAPDRRIIRVVRKGMIHKVLTCTIQPGVRGDEASRFNSLIKVVRQYTRETFSIAPTAIPAVPEISHEYLVTFLHHQQPENIDPAATLP